MRIVDLQLLTPVVQRELEMPQKQTATSQTLGVSLRMVQGTCWNALLGAGQKATAVDQLRVVAGPKELRPWAKVSHDLVQVKVNLDIRCLMESLRTEV
jgi:hypothetical protein